MKLFLLKNKKTNTNVRISYEVVDHQGLEPWTHCIQVESEHGCLQACEHETQNTQSEAEIKSLLIRIEGNKFIL